MKIFIFQHEFPDASVPKNIHKIYPTVVRKRLRFQTIDSSLPTVGIFRDPEDRFLSGFKDRVLRHREVVGLSGKNPLDDLEVFLQRFKEIKETTPSVAHHFAPQTRFLGIDPNFYDLLVPLDLMTQFMSESLRAAGVDHISAPERRIKTTEGIRLIPTEKQVKKIRALCLQEYSRDYAFLRQAEKRRLFFGAS